MVSPPILLLYSSTWKTVIKMEAPTEADMAKFVEALPVLKDALLCAVCCQLLSGTQMYSTTICDHYVCKDCKGKERTERQFCDMCEDWEEFEEDPQLEVLMAGYATLCRDFFRSKNCTRLLQEIYDANPSLNTFTVLRILKEGAKLPTSLSNTTPEQVVKLVKYSQQRKEGKCRSYEDTSDNSSHCNTNSGQDEAVEMTLEKEDEDDDSIDIKIEPVYQTGSSYDNETEVSMDMESDDSEEEYSSMDPLRQLSEQSVDEEDLNDEEIIDEDLDEAEEEDAEVYVGNMNQPQGSTQIPTSYTITSSSSAPQPQLISTPRTVTTMTFQQRPPAPSIVTSTPMMQISPRQFHSFVLTRPVATMSNPVQSPQVPGARFPGTQTIRLAKFALADGRPLTMVRQVLNNPSTSGVRHTITLPLSTSDLLKKKIIVRPANLGPSSVTTTQLQRWPDANAVLQYASGSGSVTSQGLGGVIRHKNMASSSTSSATISSGSSFTTTRPPVTKISLGNMTTGGIMASPTRMSTVSGLSTASTSSHQGTKIIGTTVVRTDNAGGSGPIKKLKVRLPKSKLSSKLRRGCRCGNAATQPGKLTCCGQRCPCYVEAKSCTDCKCRGCRNPHLPGGKKLLQGINAVIDTKTNTTVPMMAGSYGPSGSVASVAAAAAGSSSSIVATGSGMSGTPSSMNLVPVIPSSIATSSAPHIFTRILHPGTPQTSTTFSQIIPLANFAGLSGFTIPISLISPANAGHAMQAHPDTIHLQNIHHVNRNQ